MATLYDILADTPSLNVTINGGQLIEAIDYAINKKIKHLEQTEEEKMLTTEEACKAANISRPTLHRWKKAGIIPYVKIGKNVRYKHSDLMELLKTGKGGKA